MVQNPPFTDTGLDSPSVRYIQDCVARAHPLTQSPVDPLSLNGRGGDFQSVASDWPAGLKFMDFLLRAKRQAPPEKAFSSLFPPRSTPAPLGSHSGDGSRRTTGFLIGSLRVNLNCNRKIG